MLPKPYTYSGICMRKCCRVYTGVNMCRHMYALSYVCPANATVAESRVRMLSDLTDSVNVQRVASSTSPLT